MLGLSPVVYQPRKSRSVNTSLSEIANQKHGSSAECRCNGTPTAKRTTLGFSSSEEFLVNDDRFFDSVKLQFERVHQLYAAPHLLAQQSADNCKRKAISQPINEQRNGQALLTLFGQCGVLSFGARPMFGDVHDDQWMERDRD